MKPFTGGRKYQGGWVIAATVVAGIASSYSQQKAAAKKDKVSYQDQSDLSNLDFQQKNWLAQQDHAWNLEDQQFALNYKEDAIAGYRPYAGKNVASANGEWQAPPERTVRSTEGLAPLGPNGQPLIYDPRTGQPILSNAQVPQQPGTLPQLQAAG